PRKLPPKKLPPKKLPPKKLPPKKLPPRRPLTELDAITKLRDAKVAKSTPCGEVTVKVTVSKTAKTWKFDRNSYEYYVREADKGSQYHYLDLEISTESKEPLLPDFYACRFSDAGEFEVCQPLILKFYRWDDYGSYLGNYSDSGNDFSKRETVKFTIAFSATDEELKKPTVVVAKPDCRTRKEERFGRPPIYYESNCTSPTLSELADLPVIEILNKKTLASALDQQLAARSPAAAESLPTEPAAN
ncbi:MAG: hypothetical protein HC927_04965, partial [Deltaproteobacteria bacterium]|nr:hypothetical protein [Deltaproteobacteria bacterium]